LKTTIRISFLHYTPKFLEAYDKVKKVVAEKGIEAGKLAFRDAMLALGHEERVRNLYRIQDKLTKKASFFQPNVPQARYLSTKSMRNIVLKCRQVGFTTLNCIRGLDYALWEPNFRAGILCHKLGTVKTIFNDITKFSYNYFIRDWGHLYRPVEKSDSSSSLSFLHDGLGRPLESSILVMHDFRGKTLHFLHVAEASRIEGDRLVGSINGVPDNCEVTLESTAYGRGGEFYRLWQLWRSKGSTAPYKGCFVAWFEHYPEDLDRWDLSEKIQWLAKEEELLRTYAGKITEAHLMWRRWAIESKCEGNEEVFENEYPTNDQDCFISGEASVFGNTILKMQDRNTRDPIFVGHLLSAGSGKIDMHEDPKGVVTIWEAPNPGRVYAIGADPAGGLGQDRAGAYVKDVKSNKIVARIWGDIAPADFARELYKVANFYNKAFMCVEANNHGQVVLHVLKEMGYRNMYKRSTIDELTNKPTKKIGFVTTSQSKILITEKLKNAAKEGTFVILDRELISEMSTFVQVTSKTGTSVRREASVGCHDDLVMAAALTEEMASTRPVDLDNEHTPMNEDYVVDAETGFIY
jgi:hypothetical protein